MKKYLNLRVLTLLGIVVALASCGSSRTTTSRYPYPGSTYPYPGSTYPYPESYPYPRTYPTARYPRQSPPVVVYRQPQKVYVPVDKRRYEKHDHWDNRNNNHRRDRDYDRDRDHRNDNNYGNGRSNNKR